MAASKEVADRLDFLKGLEMLVFDPKSKQQLLERRQLHKIIAPNTWIFGEAFNLAVDDKSLTEVLRAHASQVGDDIVIDEPVTREDGSQGIVDLMLSRRVPMPNPTEREHLVIELKRPKTKIDIEATAQIKRYAFAISDDERFRDTQTHWTFWAVSNELSTGARKEANQHMRPVGQLYADNEGRVAIWVKTWGQIIDETKARLHFFQERLRYSANDETAQNLLHSEYEKYLPPCSAEVKETSGA